MSLGSETRLTKIPFVAMPPKPQDTSSDPPRISAQLVLAFVRGATPRKLQHWADLGLLKPRIIGHRRLYDLQDLLAVQVVAWLRRKGVSLRDAGRVLVYIRREMRAGQLREGSLVAITAAKAFHTTDPAQAIRFGADAPGGIRVIPVGDFLKLAQRQLDRI